MRLRGGFVVEMERLRVVLARELDDFLARDLVAAEARPSPDRYVLEVLQLVAQDLGASILWPSCMVE